jgi:hypothetical protein
MSMVPNDPNALLSRVHTANALTEIGFQTKPKTLATKASRGGGPPYRVFGARTLYRWGDVLAWAESRLSSLRGSTSDADVPSTYAGRRMANSEERFGDRYVSCSDCGADKVPKSTRSVADRRSKQNATNSSIEIKQSTNARPRSGKHRPAAKRAEAGGRNG